jgi:hypothetical protein
LIGSASWIALRSTITPAFPSAAAMSREVMAPNSFPSSPAFAGRTRETADSVAAVASAVFRVFFARVSIVRRS